MPRVERRRLVCTKNGDPKWKFILHLAVNNRVSLAKWGSLMCPLCKQGDEDVDHLFFESVSMLLQFGPNNYHDRDLLDNA